MEEIEGYYSTFLKKDSKISLEDDEKQKLLQMSEISIHIDTYDDIFSDFDPRPYAQRALSDDFLIEVKKACKVKESGNLEVNFLAPRKIRNGEYESLIRKRLKEYFKRHYELQKKEINHIKKKGLRFIGIGALLSLGSAYAYGYLEMFKSGFPNFLTQLIIVIMEPAGWFTIWTGLERLLSIKELKKEELIFYDKMSKAEFVFTSY